jgi:hypothetical protein
VQASELQFTWAWAWSSSLFFQYKAMDISWAKIHSKEAIQWSIEVSECPTGFIQWKVLRKLHIEPIIDSQNVGILSLHLGHLMVPKRG